MLTFEEVKEKLGGEFVKFNLANYSDNTAEYQIYTPDGQPDIYAIFRLSELDVIDPDAVINLNKLLDKARPLEIIVFDYNKPAKDNQEVIYTREE